MKEGREDFFGFLKEGGGGGGERTKEDKLDKLRVSEQPRNILGC